VIFVRFVVTIFLSLQLGTTANEERPNRGLFEDI
jgi:hypothetical protein